MKLGVGSYIWWSQGGGSLDLEAVLTEASRLGFYSVEFLCDSGFFPGWGLGDVSSEARRVRELLDSLGLKATVHCPHYDLNLSTWNLGLRAEVLRQLVDCLDVASELDSNVVVVHPGDVPSKKFTREGCFGNMVRCLRGLVRAAEDVGVTLCLENHTASPNSLCVDPCELARAVEEVGSDSLRVCLDVAHANSTDISVDDFVKPIRGKIGHVHVSDSVGGPEHLPIGAGDIDFRAWFNVLGEYRGVFTLEGWVGCGESVCVGESRRRLLRVFEGL